jgi:hypothetical protein
MNDEPLQTVKGLVIKKKKEIRENNGNIFLYVYMMNCYHALFILQVA